MLDFIKRLPRQLQFPVIGLDISDHTFKYVGLIKKANKYEIDFFGRGFIPEGIITSGKIKNAMALSEVLKKDLAQFRKTNPYIAISLPEEQGFVRPLKLPPVTEGEIRNAIDFQLETVIPLPPEEVVFDYEWVRENTEKGHMDLVIAAFPEMLVEDYASVINDAGFFPVRAEAESNAIARSVLPPSEVGSIMIVDAGYTRTSFYIVYDRVVRFTSTIQFSGEMLDSTIASALGVDMKEAHKMKKEFAITKDDKNNLMKVLDPLLLSLRKEIEKRIGFWGSHVNQNLGKNTDQANISKIYLVGGESHMTGLSEYLSQETKIPVLLSEPWKHLFDLKNYTPPITKHDSLFYATALGLALSEQ